jgi:2-oxoisovalerate dehydrogenase E2 component (dihydrolipoyl transacylase)
MSRFVFTLPDLGEGTVEAEIVAWKVKPGDQVAEEDVIAEVMTEKAVVELSAPVSGKVVSVTGGPGDKLAVGSELIVFETSAAEAQAAAKTPASESVHTASASGSAHSAVSARDQGTQQRGSSAEAQAGTSTPAANTLGGGSALGGTARAGASSSLKAGGALDGSQQSARSGAPAYSSGSTPQSGSPQSAPGGGAPSHTRGNGANGHNGASVHGRGHDESHSELAGARNGRIATSPAIRRLAREAGIDLTIVPGSGPHGRIMRKDLDAFISGRATAQQARGPVDRTGQARTPGAVEEIKVIGLRRVIAQRMAEAKRNIPHFAYVEEVDVTELESLRRHLNTKVDKGSQLTYLPFLVVALTRVLESFPQVNALYDSERNVILRHSAVHVGVATQTPDGLKVPVVRDAQARTLWEIAAEIRRVSEAARTNKATRDELSGSTITVTSLGKLGGIASTPIINAPELAIIGVNRAVERPMVYEGAITIRRMMNLSSSFDHRFVDGHDAAALIQAVKERLEHPATIFMPD